MEIATAAGVIGQKSEPKRKQGTGWAVMCSLEVFRV